MSMQAEIEFEGAKLNALTLTFKNHNLEASFIEYFGKSCTQPVRNSILLSLLFWCIALATLRYADTPHLRELTYGIVPIATPLYLILWGLTLKEKFWRMLQPFLILETVVIGFETFYLATTILQNTMMTTASLIFAYIFAFQVFPVRFTSACFATLIVLFMAAVFLLLVKPYSGDELAYIFLYSGLGWIGLAYGAYYRNLNESREFILRQKVASANAGSKNKSYQDDLTQLFNQRYLTETIKELLSPPISSSFAVVMIDIDHLSKINSAQGRQTGDNVLSEFADILRESIRQSDIPIRYGGEEFVILMKDITLDDAHIVVERMRVKTANHSFTDVKEPVTFSAGIALMKQNDLIEDTIKKAEEKISAAKKSGRNRTIV
jgi:diguanylate cyclase (GGDEF)-like protein